MRNFLFLPFFISLLAAQDGGQTYSMYCAACHGADGKGAGEGQFPPLAESPWIQGEPDRAVKAVLLGLHGTVEIKGKKFNLEMPPQGAALTDAQLAAIFTYVRSSWGNKEAAVSEDTVKKIRASLGARADHFSAEELLKIHPLPKEKVALKNLISHHYSGVWKWMPDQIATKLKADAVEEENDGFISLRNYKNKDHFLLTWDGDLTITESGEHTFTLDSDDSSKLYIDGKVISEVQGIGPAGRGVLGRVRLNTGIHKLRLEYLEFEGQEALSLGMKSPSADSYLWLTDTKEPKFDKNWKPIILSARDGKAVIYRNFILGSSPRGIGIGFPQGVNLCYSADDLAPVLMWRGDFIDAGHHWTERGVGYEAPASDDVVKLTGNSVFSLSNSNQKIDAKFHGYQLDAQNQPTFALAVEGMQILDSYQASANRIDRKIIFKGKAARPFTLLLGKNISHFSTTDFQMGKVTISVNGARLDANQSRAIIPCEIGNVNISYQWK